MLTNGIAFVVALRRSADNIIDLVSMMGRDSKMPCYAAGVTATTSTLRHRFQLHLSADEAENFVETDLIGKSYGSYYTRLYVFNTFMLSAPFFVQSLKVLFIVNCQL